jgi:hypothetical protein
MRMTVAWIDLSQGAEALDLIVLDNELQLGINGTRPN